MNCAGRKHIENIMVIMQSQSKLLEVILALGSSCGFSCLLNCRQQQGDQNSNDGDDYEQFNQSETSESRVVL
jgi:hypothetical protein